MLSRVFGFVPFLVCLRSAFPTTSILVLVKSSNFYISTFLMSVSEKL